MLLVLGIVVVAVLLAIRQRRRRPVAPLDWLDGKRPVLPPLVITSAELREN